ncbi:putative chitobiose transport system substrate-binding protein [Cytobacillus oceanisediminis]|uniref:Putative chitobiose transport system substrate-binding protein n=1 Tax=Cytobacillus oceanisediminis TaxID=665099 RepID=A0A2V2ZX34_9BACI|nr:sugar ABC transporter substrate-binding protein [Cytobacillus oceanisediminis]PWW28240.1 putative chitobiose transport system substrate-binding protein [Cytobacillus oceanisediminis]
MKRKKWLGLVMVFLLVFTPLLACSNSETASGGEGSGDKKIELEFWTINLKKNFGDYIQGMVDAYEKENPNVTIKWVDVPGADASKKFITAMQSKDIPDVVNLSSSDISLIRRYNVLSPINDLVKEEELSPYIDGLIEGLTFEDDLLAIPWYHGGPPVGFLNTELYKQAGLDPESPPENWKELLENGKKIHEKLPKVYGSNDIPSMEVLVGQGLPILNKKGTKPVFNSEEHVEFVELFVEAYENGSVAPGAISEDDRQLQQTFENGQQAHVGQKLVSGLVNIEKNAPTILPKLKVFKPITGEDGTVAIGGIQTFVVPKKSEHPEEAAKFALFVTNAKNQLEFTKLVSIFPSTEETLKDPFFKDFEVKTIHDEARKLMVEIAPNLTINILGINKEEELKKYYLEQIRAAMLGEKTVKEALDDAAAHWEKELSK